MNRKLAILTAMGFEAFGLVAVLVLIGRAIDKAYHINGLATAAGGIIAVIAWLTHILLVVKKLANESDGAANSEVTKKDL